MPYILNEIETLIDNNNYTDLEHYIHKNKENSDCIIALLEFKKDNRNSFYLDNIINIINKYLSDSELNKSDKTNRKDVRYKADVKALCNNKCVVTNKILCNEVAHIQEFNKCEYDNDKYSKFNGLYLTSYIHKLWDTCHLVIIDYSNDTEDIFFKINIEELNKRTNKAEVLKEISEECLIIDTEYNNITLEELKIPININKINFKNYKYYINKRNNK